MSETPRIETNETTPQSEISKRLGTVANSAAELIARKLDQKDPGVQVGRGVNGEITAGMPKLTWLVIDKPAGSNLKGDKCRLNVRDARMVQRADGGTGYDCLTVEISGTKPSDYGNSDYVLNDGDGYQLSIISNAQTGYPELTYGTLHNKDGGGSSWQMREGDLGASTAVREAQLLLDAANAAMPSELPAPDGYGPVSYHLGQSK